MKPRTLAKPPIVHAALEIRFEPNKNVQLERLKDFSQSLSDDYPNIADVSSNTVQFGIDKDKTPFQSMESEIKGRAITNQSQTKTINAELSQFSAAYQNGFYAPWDDFEQSFLDHYNNYLEYSKQSRIVRIGARYVNEVFLPIGQSGEISDCLTTRVAIPTSEEVPDTFSGFSTEVFIPFGGPYHARVVQQTRGPKQHETTGAIGLVFLLDTDVWFQGELDVGADDDLKGILNILRVKKNAIFFNTFTDKVIDQYA